MFVRQVQNQFRIANADVQMFYQDSIWSKPTGVSQIYMMLIGAGGAGGSGCGSGAVTTWWGAAQNVPDSLKIHPGTGASNNTTVSYVGSSTTDLLTANSGTSATTGASAMTANQFSASGFFQSVAGQNGTATTVAASTTTFLSGGCSGTTITSNYGYGTVEQGIFQLQPVIVGTGSVTANKAGIGCGAGNASGSGGTGFILIASW